MTLMLTSCALALFLTAAISDIRERRIPNALTFALAAIGLTRIALDLTGGIAPLPLIIDLAAALALFVLAATGFHLGLIGGGDVKLLAAGAVWLGAAALPAYLMATVLAGGVLGLVLLAAHRLRRSRAPAPSLPYGVAIAFGGVVAATGWLAPPPIP